MKARLALLPSVGRLGHDDLHLHGDDLLKPAVGVGATRGPALGFRSGVGDCHERQERAFRDVRPVRLRVYGDSPFLEDGAKRLARAQRICGEHLLVEAICDIRGASISGAPRTNMGYYYAFLPI
jgi:hypothetical protein